MYHWNGGKYGNVYIIINIIIIIQLLLYACSHLIKSPYVFPAVKAIVICISFQYVSTKLIKVTFRSHNVEVMLFRHFFK